MLYDYGRTSICVCWLIDCSVAAAAGGDDDAVEDDNGVQLDNCTHSFMMIIFNSFHIKRSTVRHIIIIFPINVGLRTARLLMGILYGFGLM